MSGSKSKSVSDTSKPSGNGDRVAPVKLYVNVVLQGPEVEQFLNYKAAKFLLNKSEAGRSLMLERLSQLMPAA